MISIIKNEFLKLFKERKFYIVNLLCLVIGVVVVLSYRKVLPTVAGDELLKTFSTSINFILPYWGILLISSIFTDDYKNGTMKLSLISSISRTEYLIGKIIFIFITMLIIAIVNYIGAIILNIILSYSMTSTAILQGILQYLSITIPAMAFIGIIVVPALVLNNGGNTVTLGILLLLFLQIGGSFVFKKFNKFNIVNHFGIIESLDIGKVISISIVYLIIEIIISIIIFNKKEITT